MRRSEINSTYTVSPLNYIGGKARILDQILPIFPNDIDHFVDLFCGGCNVGINTRAEDYYYNDNQTELIGLLMMFKRMNIKTLLKKLDSLVDYYGFSKTKDHDFKFYGGNPMKGVSVYNRQKFLDLRDDFNASTVRNNQHYVLLYMLIIFGFNNQIRFNSEGKYNLPVGKRDFNNVLREKLIAFIEVLKRQDTHFSRYDFRRFPKDFLTPRSLVYADPPYLITDATYNENNGWSAQDEYDLLAYLDDLTERGLRFALSNVLRHKGEENRILIDWLAARHYQVHNVNMDYSNSNYQVVGKDSGTVEVLVTNY